MSFLNYMMKGLVKNMSNIWTIVKKELKRFFTDPRMIIGLVLPGVLIFVIYNLMGNISMEKIAPTITDFTVYVENEPTEFQSFLNKDGWNINKNKENLSKDKIIDKIKDKEADLYIIYEEDFYQKMLAYDIDTGKMAPNIEIYYNSTSESSNLFYSYYLEILNQYESNISNKFDINRDLDIKYDVAKKEDTTIQIISMMLPFLLMVFLFSGAMGVCSESVAGEKERGTIATLLITPTKRSHIAIGKILSLGITSLVSALVSFLGLMLSLPKLMGTDFSFQAYGLSTILLMLVLIAMTVLLFTTLLTIVSTFAKSVKEATSYAIPLMMIVLLVGITNFMSTTATSNKLLYIIPIYNIVQCLIGVFSITIDPVSFLICITSNIVYIGLGVFLLTKMFNNERVIFNR